MVKVAINGLGRIGRAVFKILLDTDKAEILAVNDLAEIENLAYLLKYDSVYGRYEKKVEAANDKLVIDGKNYRVMSEKDPSMLPWKELGIDVVLECTGVFTKKENARQLPLRKSCLSIKENSTVLRCACLCR